MRAAVFREPGAPLSVEEVRLDEPLPDEVRLDVLACAICQSDVSYLDGHWSAELPVVLGHEAVGRVTEIGNAVDAVAIGDIVSMSLIRSCGECRYCRRGESVCCEGRPRRETSPLTALDGTSIAHGLGVAGFAEQAVVHHSQVVAIPPSMPIDTAALLGCGVITGFGAVANTATMSPGSAAVVVGCGGVGLNAVQGARIAGAAAIVAVDPAPAKLGAAAQLGATHVADPTADDVAAVVRAANDGRGADHVFVTVGSKAAMESAFELLAPGGTLVLVGMAADGVKIEIDPTTVAARNQRVLGSKMGSATLARDVPRLVELYRAGELHLDELVSARFSLDDVNEAIAASRQADSRRVVVTMRS